MTFRSGQVPVLTCKTSHFPFHLWFTHTTGHHTLPWPLSDSQQSALAQHYVQVNQGQSDYRLCPCLQACVQCETSHNYGSVQMNMCAQKHDPLCNRPIKTGEAQNGLLNIIQKPVTGHIHFKRKTQAWERSA